jgi:hypothetical protein
LFTIIEQNPHVFIERFVAAIKHGYVVENTNRGWVVDGTLKEINLFKTKDEYYCTKILEYGETVISDYDAQAFLEKLQGAVWQKADVSVESLYWNLTGVKSIKISLTAPNNYSKEQLDDLSWDDLKEECKRYGITGRDRSVLINRYLKVISGEVT